MADIFDQIHAERTQQPQGPPPASGDIFDQIHAQRTPQQQGPSDQRGTPYTVQPQGTAGERLGSNLWENTIGGLVNYGRGIADLAVQGARAASGQPPMPGPGMEMVQGITAGHVEQAKKTAKSVTKAVDAVKRGNIGEALNHYTEAFGHGLATATPLIGPAAAAAGEKIGGEEGQLDKYGNVIQPGQAPDVAGGLGAGLGQILSVVAPAAGKAAIGKVAGKAGEALKYKSVLNPTVEQPAVDWAREPRGFDPDTGQPIPRVQLSPGTITGNKFLQAREALTQNRPFGAKEGAQFRRGTEADLQREAGRLSQADQPITPEGAGRLVGSRVQGKATALETDLANQAHPQAVTPETVGRAPAAKMDKIIQAETLKKNAAYEQAWQGRDDPAFSQSVPVRMARGEEVLNDETGQGTGIYEQRPVMQSVSMPVDVRGLKMMAEPIYDQMSIRLTPAEQNTSQGYHALGVLLKGDDFWPAWKAEPVLSGLKSMARLEKGEAVRDVSQGIGAHLIPELQQRIDAAVAATGDDAIRGLQEGRRVHAGIMDVEDIAKQLREKEPVKNFNRLVQPDDTNIDFLRQVQNLAPEHMPAVGRAYLPEIFDRGRPAWEALGPETRKIFYPDPNVHAGIENYLGVRDVARQLANKGGVDQFATMIEPRDGNVDFLRQVQKLTAPEDMDAVGRALVQQQVSRAMREGGFGKTVGLLNWWRELGDQTKQILIRDPGVRTELNHFFKVADMAAHAPNPSGTALVAGSDTMDPRKIVMGWIGSKALFTPRGISILTDSLTPQSPGAAALTQAKIRALAAKAPPEEPPQGPPEEPPTGGGGSEPGTPPPPPPPPGAPPGSGGGAAALQGGLERNAATVAASKAKLTGRPDVESNPVQQQPGLTEKPQAIDNPQNQYQYTTPEGIPVYKAPGESTPPGGSPDVRLGPGDFLTEKPALQPATQSTPPGSSPGEPAIPPGQEQPPPPGAAGRTAFQNARQRIADTVAASKAKLTGDVPLRERISQFFSSEEGPMPRRPKADPIGEVALRFLMDEPLELKGDKTVDVGRAIRQRVRSHGGALVPGEDPEVRAARAYAAMTDDLDYALASQPKARDWYDGDVKAMESQLVQNRPEFEDPGKRSLFKFLLGVTSNGVDPETNFDAANRGWDLYKEHGRFMAYDPTRKSALSNSGQVGLTFRANSYQTAMSLLDRLVQEKEEGGAVDWLTQKHSIEELKKYDPKITVGDGSPRYGAYILGEKVGSFGLNLNGIYSELTADKWWSRTWNRWMGTTLATDAEGKLKVGKEGEHLMQDDPRNEGERALMRTTATRVAGKMGLSVAELQAVLWYAEQALYRAHGLKASSMDYNTAAKNFFAKTAKKVSGGASPGPLPVPSPPRPGIQSGPPP